MLFTPEVLNDRAVVRETCAKKARLQNREMELVCAKSISFGLFAMSLRRATAYDGSSQYHLSPTAASIRFRADYLFKIESKFRWCYRLTVIRHTKGSWEELRILYSRDNSLVPKYQAKDHHTSWLVSFVSFLFCTFHIKYWMIKLLSACSSGFNWPLTPTIPATQTHTLAGRFQTPGPSRSRGSSLLWLR